MRVTAHEGRDDNGQQHGRGGGKRFVDPIWRVSPGNRHRRMPHGAVGENTRTRSPAASPLPGIVPFTTG